MKFWVTKYALSSGITEVEAESSEVSDNMICVKDSWHEMYHGEGREWHRTYDAAVARAEQMRMDKIRSLRKSITKMEKLTWRKP